MEGVPVMKIENNYNKYLQSIKQTNNNRTASKTDKQAIEPKQEKHVEITISEEAKKLSEVTQQEVYSERVQEVKLAIQNGTFEVKPKEISESIMREINAQKGSEE